MIIRASFAFKCRSSYAGHAPASIYQNFLKALIPSPLS